MPNWSPLRQRLVLVDDRLTIDWSDLDHLVGGLPRSACVHPAFWRGVRRQRSGFSTTDVGVGETVTFVRCNDRQAAERCPETPLTQGTPRVQAPRVSLQPTANLPGLRHGAADIVLVGCVKTKLDRPATARDL